MHPDKTEIFEGALIQHGPLNNRIYVMKTGCGNTPRMPGLLEDFARERGYSKIIAKVPETEAVFFSSSGYREEGRIPGMFGGVHDGCFMARYMDPERSVAPDERTILEVLASALSLPGKEGTSPAEGVGIKGASPADAPALAAVFGEVFDSYPFPITDPAFLRGAMERGDACYYAAWEGERIIAASAAEIDRDARCAEVTDFATLPEARGRGLSSALLARMEEDLHESGVLTSYTICRAVHPPINRIFARAGYSFCGTLIQNTHICGRCESMNVWGKGI